MVRILLTSDNHLNAHYAKMGPSVLAERRKLIRERWRDAVNYALNNECHLFLQAGDLFDMPDPRTTELVAVAQDFRRLHEAGIKVFCIGGTHDVHRMATTGVLALRIYHETGHAHVFTSSTDPAPVVTEIDGLRIAVGGLSVSHTFGRGDDPLEGVTYEADADFKILLMHYGVEGMIHPDAAEPILSKDSLQKIGVHLVAVGHVHNHKKIMLPDTTVIVPGSTERHTFGEKDVQTGYYCLEVDKKGLCKTEHIPVVPQQMHEEIVKTSELDAEDPTNSLLERIRAVSKNKQLLKVVLFGPMGSEVFHKLRLREAYLVGVESNFYFDLDSRGLHVSNGPRLVSDGTESVSISQRQEIADVAAELMNMAQTEEERALYTEARERILANYL